MTTIFAPMSGPEAIERESMVTEISIKPANKTSAKLETTEINRNDWVTRVASEAYEDEDVSQYTIVLDDGSEWRDGELKLRRSIKLEVDGSSYDVPQALQEMMKYLQFLKKNELVE